MTDASAKVLKGLLDAFLLESLEHGPKHAYALLREMAETFGAAPNRNRLYPLLVKMEESGLLRQVSEPSGTRTLYAITDAGRASLDTYRRLPPAFRERAARLWGADAPRAPPASPEARAVPILAAPARASSPASSPTPATAPAPGEALPYPCIDARVGLEKDPRTGDLRVTLTGCPMGAYDYCALCPISRAVEGLRRLTLP